MMYQHNMRLFFEEGLSEIPFKENDKIKIIIKGQNKGHVPISREETMDLIYKTLYQD